MPFVTPEGAVLTSAEYETQDFVAHPRTFSFRQRRQSLQNVEVSADRGIQFMFKDREVLVAFVGKQACPVDLVACTSKR